MKHFLALLSLLLFLPIATAQERVTIKLDRDSVAFEVPSESEWVYEDGWRFCARRQAFGDLLALVTLEQFEGIEATRVTWALINGFPGVGAVLFNELGVWYGRESIYAVLPDSSPGPDAIQVRGILARRHYGGPRASSLAAYEHVKPTEGYPDWAPEVCSQGLLQASASFVEGDPYKTGAQRVGIYRIGTPGVKGSSSLNGSHGGWSVAPWHFGPEGWQRCSRDGYRWAEVDMFDTLDRSPLAIYSRKTLHPWNPHVPYWPGRANVELPGYAPDPDPACPYLPELEKWEAHAYSHLHREIAAPAMLAPKDVFARILLVEVYWQDGALWLDGAESSNELLQTARQVIREWPAHKGWSVGGRGFAHTVKSLIYALPYFNARKRGSTYRDYHPEQLTDGGLWTDVIVQLIKHVARPNGIIMSWKEEPSDPKVAPAARAREVDLMYPNLVYLRLKGLEKACRETMAPHDGDSVSAAFEPTHRHWYEGDHTPPNYYQPYDWIRGDGLETFDPNKRWYSPFEQTLSMVPPRILFTLVKK